MQALPHALVFGAGVRLRDITKVGFLEVFNNHGHGYCGFSAARRPKVSRNYTVSACQARAIAFESLKPIPFIFHSRSKCDCPEEATPDVCGPQSDLDRRRHHRGLSGGRMNSMPDNGPGDRIESYPPRSRDDIACSTLGYTR